MLIVFTARWHGRFSMDPDGGGIQKFHTSPVPRIGGIALVIGIVAAFLNSVGDNSVIGLPDDINNMFRLILAGMPAFFAGLVEDMTKKVSVKARLTATIASALLAYWLLGAYLPRVDVWGIDATLRFMPLALIVTAIAVAGVANSINIIDGFHGVAGSAVVIILAGLGFLAWQSGDMFVTRLAVLGIGTTIGFLLVNYPTGRLFMGDGGAYFLGFWTAEIAVLLVMRNPEVSAWQVLAVCAYPVIEVLYSIYRRTVIRKVSPGLPDRLHLHTLIYRRVVCRLIPRHRQPWLRNAAVAWFVGTWIAAMALLAVHFGNGTAAALGVISVNVLLYLAVYTRLVRGHWQMLRRSPVQTRLRPVGRLAVRKTR
jgi:UDP-N-acetylmuramyl pentapeptide phosphotransferase/UDP-N-acetylglucosamine-1-phosphate transferase